jgi:hypothetical protein
MQKETDHISESKLLEAYQWGWDCYPDSGNPYETLGESPLLVQAFSEGWEDAKKDHP